MNVMFTLINQARTPSEFYASALSIQGALQHGNLEEPGALMMHLAYKGHALLAAYSVKDYDDATIAAAARTISTAVAETMACLDDDFAEAAS